MSYATSTFELHRSGDAEEAAADAVDAALAAAKQQQQQLQDQQLHESQHEGAPVGTAALPELTAPEAAAAQAQQPFNSHLNTAPVPLAAATVGGGAGAAAFDVNGMPIKSFKPAHAGDAVAEHAAPQTPTVVSAHEATAVFGDNKVSGQAAAALAASAGAARGGSKGGQQNFAWLLLGVLFFSVGTIFCQRVFGKRMHNSSLDKTV